MPFRAFRGQKKTKPEPNQNQMKIIKTIGEAKETALAVTRLISTRMRANNRAQRAILKAQADADKRDAEYRREIADKAKALGAFMQYHPELATDEEIRIATDPLWQREIQNIDIHLAAFGNPLNEVNEVNEVNVVHPVNPVNPVQ